MGITHAPCPISDHHHHHHHHHEYKMVGPNFIITKIPFVEWASLMWWVNSSYKIFVIKSIRCGWGGGDRLICFFLFLLCNFFLFLWFSFLFWFLTPLFRLPFFFPLTQSSFRKLYLFVSLYLKPSTQQELSSNLSVIWCSIYSNKQPP